MYSRTSPSFDTELYARPAKRKRVSGDQDGPPGKETSTIEDIRVKPSRGLRINCAPITVIVGPADDEQDTDADNTQSTVGHSKQQTFYVHEDVITASSPFFRNAMKPTWASSREDPRTITLPNDNPAAFSLYLTWLYSGKLPVLAEVETPGFNDPDLDQGFRTLSHAYVLGDSLMDTAFQNAVADAYVLFARSAGEPGHHRSYPSNEDIRILFDGTHEHSPIRGLILDIWSRRGRHDWIQKNEDELPYEFLAAITKELLKVRDNTENLSRPWKYAHEQYHVRDTTSSGSGP